MNIVLVTDLHLDFIRVPGLLETLYRSIKAKGPDLIISTGDVANDASWTKFLVQLRDATGVPLYFVLGNHDFWGSSLHETRQLARDLTGAAKDSPKWLTELGVIKLTDKVSLVGHDGWYDCQNLPERLPMIMNDWLYILDFTSYAGMYGSSNSVDKHHVEVVSRQLAEDAGKALQDSICAAFAEGAQEVIAATHVPPFVEASLYERKPATNPFFFAAPTIGARLKLVMEAWPDRKLTILCGHTHDRAEYQAASNLRCIVGAAKYGYPQIAQVLRR